MDNRYYTFENSFGAKITYNREEFVKIMDSQDYNTFVIPKEIPEDSYYLKETNEPF